MDSVAICFEMEKMSSFPELEEGLSFSRKGRMSTFLGVGLRRVGEARVLGLVCEWRRFFAVGRLTKNKEVRAAAFRAPEFRQRATNNRQ